MSMTLLSAVLITKYCNFLQGWQSRTSWFASATSMDPWHNVAIINGEAGCGKTITLQYWRYLNSDNLNIINTKQLLKCDIADIAPLLGQHLALDDADVLFNRKPELLLHLINSFQQGSHKLLLTTSQLPATMESSLPDLNSRWLALANYSFKPLDSDELAMFWLQHQSLRQLKIDSSVTKYILSRIKRTPADIRRVIDLLDQESARRQVKITIPFAKGVLGYV